MLSCGPPNQNSAVVLFYHATATAETFVQTPQNPPTKTELNCFLCHNPASYSFQSSPPPLASRLIALSHVLAVGSLYEVPNSISSKLPLRPDLVRKWRRRLRVELSCRRRTMSGCGVTHALAGGLNHWIGRCASPRMRADEGARVHAAVRP